ncbi:hypothetical protein Ae201684P_000651 [Aphanomyces euteiches]|nr:hypothetical protein Ae201684P_000651 [Aphanomyces euteiches]
MDSFAVLFIFVAVVAVVQVYKWLQVTQAARCAFEQLSLEGLKKLAVDEADKDGMVQFYLVGKPWISVLKAEHVRQVLNVSNFRRSNPIMKLSSSSRYSWVSLGNFIVSGYQSLWMAKSRSSLPTA